MASLIYVDPARNIIKPMDMHAVDMDKDAAPSWKERQRDSWRG